MLREPEEMEEEIVTGAACFVGTSAFHGDLLAVPGLFVWLGFCLCCDTACKKKDDEDEEDHGEGSAESDDDYDDEGEEALRPLDTEDVRQMMVERFLELEDEGEETTEEGLIRWCMEEMDEEIDTEEEFDRHFELACSTLRRMVDDREVLLGRSSWPEGRVLRLRTGGGRHVACAGSGPRPEQLPRGGGGRLRGRSTSPGG